MEGSICPMCFIGTLEGLWDQGILQYFFCRECGYIKYVTVETTR